MPTHLGDNPRARYPRVPYLPCVFRYLSSLRCFPSTAKAVTTYRTASTSCPTYPLPKRPLPRLLAMNHRRRVPPHGDYSVGLGLLEHLDDWAAYFGLNGGHACCSDRKGEWLTPKNNSSFR